MGFDMENVLQAIRRREQGVFKQLFESYFKKMTLFAEYFLLDRGEAEDTGKEDFFEFYERFANDSVFQLSRLHEPLKFVTADPEDEFQILETTLEAGQWFAFQPVLPRENLTNVNYGQNENVHSNTKVIEMKGFGNGFNNTLYFERRHGLWKLMQFEDLSD